MTDKLSLGVAGQFFYSDLEMKLRIPDLATGKPDSRVKLDGDDTGGGSCEIVYLQDLMVEDRS